VIFTKNPVAAVLGCFFSSFIFCVLGIKILLHYMRKYRKFQPIRIEGPESHQKKAKTPTMAGIVVSLSLLFNITLFCDLKSPQILVALGLIAAFSCIGLLDDVIKVFYDDTNGFRGSKKLILQLLSAATGILYLCLRNPEYASVSLLIPLTNLRVPLYILTPAFYMLIVCGSSNAANMTDGLDGLLAVPVILISATFMAMLTIPGSRQYFYGLLGRDAVFDLTMVIASTMASFCGFLIYNIHPAKIFLGDVGSLMVGALLCYIAILLRVELIYALMATLFIVEILSTMLQIGYYKITKGRRLFRMAPFHHHLEKSGMSEISVVNRLWFFSLVCCLLALALLYCTLVW
jgi:phospho-N-acetylmuramoyl-pentapeptide-transferase